MNISRALGSIKKIRHSIAYLTSIIILCYVAVGIAAVSFDVTDLPDFLNFINFDHPDTARTLLATLIAGMISLLVFSFSMVMSVLTQAGSNFSNKLVFGMMTEKIHQHVLGHYLGTILYILILLLVPVDGGTPDTWRSLAVYLGAAMVINSLVMFIFFIHGTSQSVQINAITQGLLESTQRSFKKLKKRQENRFYIHGRCDVNTALCYLIYSHDSGYVQNADFERLAKIARNKNLSIHINFGFGDFVVRNFPIINVESERPVDKETANSVLSCLHYVEGESTEDHYVNGLTQLMEVAIKALSPGINDPGTARLCLHQITELLSQRLGLTPCNMMVDAEGKCLVSWQEESFDSLMFRIFDPILHYGESDLSICLSLLKAFKTLSNFAEASDNKVIQGHTDRVIKIMADNFKDPLEVEFVEARLGAGVHRLNIGSTLQKNVTAP